MVIVSSWKRIVKHIIIITTSYPEICDGREAAGSFVVDLAEVLAEKIMVTVIAPGLKAGNDERHGNLVVHRFHAPRQPLSLLKVYNPLHWAAIIRTLAHGKKAVECIAESYQVDHIFALWVLPSGYWARAAGKRFDIPYSTWALGSDIWSLGRIPVVKTVLQRVLQNSFKNFADGFQLRNDVKLLSQAACEFLPSTRKISFNKPRKKSEHVPYRLAFLGRWHRNKGVDLLLESLFLLEENSWRSIREVRICGGGPLYDQVVADISLLKKKGKPVVSKGYLNKNEAMDLFLWADYVLIPSRIESIPIVFSDAIKCMCPVVCMPVGDLTYLIAEHKVGFVSKKVTAKEFAVAIRQCLQHAPKEFTEGLESASNVFDLDRVVEKIMRQLSI